LYGCLHPNWAKEKCRNRFRERLNKSKFFTLAKSNLTIMSKQTRKTFLATASALTLGVTSSFAMEKNAPLVHHVFFWLKNPTSKEDLAKLLEGLRTLKKIETIKMLHIGVPASTEKRDVVDNS
jgi:hypothetical protein